MSSNNRDFLLEQISGKGPKKKEYYSVDIIAIEDEEQRFVTTIQVEQGLIDWGNSFSRVARPNGYELIWQHKHYHDFNVHVLTPEQVAAMPKAVGDYSYQVERIRRLHAWIGFANDYQVTDLDKVLEQERVESQDADGDMSVATYLFWRKLTGLDYNESEMETCWRRYCEYRRKYGLKVEKIFPAFKVEK